MEVLQYMDEYQSKADMAKALFEQHFLPPLKERNINGNLGSGQDVLMELERTMPDSPTPEEQAEIGESLRMLAVSMAAAYYAQNEIMGDRSDPYWEADRLHESAFRGALFALCPIFPFCGPPKSR